MTARRILGYIAPLNPVKVYAENCTSCNRVLIRMIWSDGAITGADCRCGG